MSNPKEASDNPNPTGHPTPQPRLTSLSHGGGCGCKIAPGVLASILKGMTAMPIPKELLVGIETSDDAAVYQLNDEQALIATTDFFMPIVDDPFDFGRIAATNAISDVYAMGGKPILALALVNYASFLTLRGLWLGPLLMHRHGMSLVQTGNVALVVSVLSLFTPALFGHFDPGPARRRPWIVRAALAIAVVFALMAFLPLDWVDVGGMVAVAVLSSGPPRELLAAIAGGDAPRFQAVPGIGKRTAERIIVELREKVGIESQSDGLRLVGHGEGPLALARDGLLTLGYTPPEAEQLLRDVKGESAEELIAEALRTARTA